MNLLSCSKKFFLLYSPLMRSSFSLKSNKMRVVFDTKYGIKYFMSEKKVLYLWVNIKVVLQTLKNIVK